MSTASMTLVAWMEPLLMLGIGGMFGLVVIAMFMPLIKLLNDLS
jgi:type II secretory pathway component PulF